MDAVNFSSSAHWRDGVRDNVFGLERDVVVICLLQSSVPANGRGVKA
jgi:Iap family predicted aminopeptidase